MKNINSILSEQLREQLAIEEHLCKMLEEQIYAIQEEKFSDAKGLLIVAKEVLNKHFIALNELLDQLEHQYTDSRGLEVNYKGNGIDSDLESNDGDKPKNRKISRMLRDDYSALNLVTISNTSLHTLALALDSKNVANLALRHLENLTPLVVELGELMPEIVARELHAELPDIDLTCSHKALHNTKLAWKRASKS